MASAQETEREEQRTRGDGRGDGRTHLERAEGREHRRPLGSLLRELTREASALVRGEMILAKSEIKEDISKVQKGVSSAATGGAVLHAGILALVAAAILALALIWPAWLAALVVGGGIAIIGAILVVAARSQVKPEKLKPERTMQSLDRDRTFVAEEKQQAVERMR